MLTDAGHVGYCAVGRGQTILKLVLLSGHAGFRIYRFWHRFVCITVAFYDIELFESGCYMYIRIHAENLYGQQ